MPPAQFIRQMLSTNIYLDKFTKLLSQHTSIDDVRGFIYLLISLFITCCEPHSHGGGPPGTCNQIRVIWSTATRS